MMNTQNNEKQTNVRQQPAAVWQDEVLTDLSVSGEQAEQTKGGPGGSPQAEVITPVLSRFLATN